jgi:hypothetical protein
VNRILLECDALDSPVFFKFGSRARALPSFVASLKFNATIAGWREPLQPALLPDLISVIDASRPLFVCDSKERS